MVMSLSKPAICSLKLVNDVVAERQHGENRAYFKRIEAEWLRRVAEYISKRGSPKFVKNWPEADLKKKTFINLYKNPKEGSSQDVMLSVLRDHSLNLCPACGEMGKPNTLDHYLPKGI